jgi:hypothetical protein
MSTSLHAIRPAKRRKTKKVDRLRENDVEALEAATFERFVVETSKGPIERKKLIPIPKSQNSKNNPTTTLETLQEYNNNSEYSNFDNVDMEDELAVPAENTKAS